MARSPPRDVYHVRTHLRQDQASINRVENRSDGFDLYKLIFVAKHSDAHQRTGDVVLAERVPDYLPCGYQILLPA
jgi:hypothetical protein